MKYIALNESPSEKEGKSPRASLFTQHVKPSMKVPPKRKGNSSPFSLGTSSLCPPQ